MGSAPFLGEPPPPRGPPRWLLYVDLDAFYVACELRDRPGLVGRPVIVGPPPTGPASRGVVLSASYEARAFGVHSAQPAVAAQRLCPDATWIPPDFAKYGRIAEAALALLRRHAPRVVPYSIDEAVVLPDVHSADSARAAAEAIQRALHDELGLGASVGVATSRLVAKMASDRAKPGKIVVVAPEAVAAFVAPLPVRAVPGVGPRTEELLHDRGLETVGDLARLRPSDLVRTLGGFGRELVALARGTPSEAIGEETGPRSRSADHTFERDADAWEAIAPVVEGLAEELASSVARERLRFGGVGVAFRWGDFERTQRSRTLAAAREGPAALRETALYLARQLWQAEEGAGGRPVRTVSVRVERLADRTQHQASLEEFEPRRSPSVK